MRSAAATVRSPASRRHERDRRIGVFEYVELTDFIGGLFPVRVDVANRAKLKPHIRPQAECEAVQAF